MQTLTCRTCKKVVKIHKYQGNVGKYACSKCRLGTEVQVKNKKHWQNTKGVAIENKNTEKAI